MSENPEKSVLIIDDNEKNLKLARDIVQAIGVETMEAETAEHGIKLANEHKPDLILMDIQLPGMDGLSATRLLKSNDDTKDIVIVALTASAMRGDEKKSLDAGCDGYITKPIDYKSFVADIKSYLNIH